MRDRERGCGGTDRRDAADPHQRNAEDAGDQVEDDVQHRGNEEGRAKRGEDGPQRRCRGESRIGNAARELEGLREFASQSVDHRPPILAR